MNEDKARYLTVPRLAAVAGLVHGFGDARWSEADFLAFAASRGLEPVIMRQLHSDAVHRLDAAPAGKLEGDALMTNVPGLLLVIRTADCLPVFLADAKNRVVAAVHCGWRGTEKRILEKAVKTMGRAYGSAPAEMLAALGPCIGSACYEVGPKVRGGFTRAGFPASVFTEFEERGHLPKVPRGADYESKERGTRTAPPEAVHVPDRPAAASERPHKSLLDLRAANRWLLEAMGFKKVDILDTGPACTHCEPHLLSYRRDPADPRRMYNFIGFTPG